MKKFSIFMLAALTLVACNKEQNAVVEQQEAAQIPVGFNAYVNRPTTKAGLFNPNLAIGNLQGVSPAVPCGGIGVFAYYTNADNYDQTFMPNFMYNQQVLYANSTKGWRYTPVKYWPNEFGNNAYSDDADKISFFAYAPFVEVNPPSGKVKQQGTAPYNPWENGRITEGIVGMKRNNALGDPMIQYKVSAYTNQQVDLLWGVVGPNSASADTVNWHRKNGTPQGLLKYYPYLNVEHPRGTSNNENMNGQEVKFTFFHALASLNVTVDTKTNSTSTAAPAAGTKVFIRSVTFEGFDVKGALNLNNTNIEPLGKALWYNFDFSNELNNGAEFTIYDGRKDGKEGLTAASKEYAAINPTFVQSTVWDSTSPAPSAGVTNAAVNLFCQKDETNPSAPTYAAPNEETDPILVIPNGDKLKVTIEYDVLTKDASLAGMLNDGVTPGSVVKNVITRYITRGASAQGSVGEPSATAPGATPGDGDAIILENGKQYTIKLHLGLNSVEFDAAVTAWPDTPINGGADLPHNN